MRGAILPALLAVLTATVAAQTPITGEDPFELMTAAQTERLLELAGAELDAAEVPIARKLDLLRALATTHLAQAESDPAHREDARAAMVAMLKLDAQADFTPGHRFPPQVHALFRDVREEVRSGDEVVSDPRRVAVAPFFLIDMGASSKFDWQDYCEALTFMIAGDLQTAPGLIVLSRDQMDAIRGELALSSQAELVSAENRIRLQRLLSASSFVYGEVQALPGDEIWLEVRWVHTESGAVLAAHHGRQRIRKGADLLALEHEVVLEKLLPAMLAEMGMAQAGAEAGRVREHVRRKLAQAAKGDTYLHYVAAVARANAAERSGDMQAALHHWESARRELPEHAAPIERIRALKLFYGGAPQDSGAATEGTTP